MIRFSTRAAERVVTAKAAVEAPLASSPAAVGKEQVSSIGELPLGETAETASPPAKTKARAPRKSKIVAEAAASELDLS